jgi:glycine hydroxymethyltransferase
VDPLTRCDRELAALLAEEKRRQDASLMMVAACSPAEPAVLACQAAAVGHVTAEGYPGERYHGGCAGVDALEELAIRRATSLFGASHANVQPHSGSSANHAVLLALLQPGDALLGLELAAGGHLTHGAPVSLSGQLFRALSYGLDADGRIDLGEARRLALKERPKLIFAGATAYPRTIDFAAFRDIADEVGAYLVADISHIAGLVAAGEHPSPIPYAHVTTTSTYKQLQGPRGGLILTSDDKLARAIGRAVFPMLQGTPSFGAIAAKACALHLAAQPPFRARMQLVVADARHLAASLAARGHDVCSGGTDNHLVLVRTVGRGLTGAQAERLLEACNIVVNKNLVPGDSLPPSVAGGIRLGTNWVAAQGMGTAEMEICAALVDEGMGEAARERVRAGVAELAARFPLR